MFQKTLYFEQNVTMLIPFLYSVFTKSTNKDSRLLLLLLLLLLLTPLAHVCQTNRSAGSPFQSQKIRLK